MKGSAFHSVRGRFHRIPAFLFVVILLAVGPPAFGFTLQVVDGNGTPIPVGYRWLVEEDTTHPVTPRVQDNNSLGVNIHNSYAPVAAKGTSADLARLNDPNLIDPSKRYVISVLPDNTYSMGGANIAAGQSVVKVVCQGYPLPTAQISVLVFHDIMPINSAPDAPAEPGLAGFKILLFEQAGQVTVDAFGNNLGSTYVKN
ncbi:MAG: signal peptide protein, partial [Deltaproteobacteria bacterium]|nr:signal peptide protein [Deltaproteobacteria bacterium]